MEQNYLIFVGLALAATVVFFVGFFLWKNGAKKTKELEKGRDSDPLTEIKTGSPVAEKVPVETREPTTSVKTSEITSEPPTEHVSEKTTVEVQEPKKLSDALSNTRQSFFGRIKGMFSGKPTIASDELEEIEEILYTSDLGPKTVQLLLAAVEDQLKAEGTSGLEALRDALKKKMLEVFESLPEETAKSDIQGLETIQMQSEGPTVWMIVGVNGAGKTTTIGKLAGKLAQEGKKVLLAAGDTFRAAAGEQLKVWTDRAQVEIFSPPDVKDPSAVAFDALQKAKARGFDVVIVDTAGRLHTQKNLMEELKKMKRVMKKVMEDAPHETLLVLDANSGQNALIQANEFHGALGVSGVVLTKMDGTAKGGVALGVAHELQIPVKLIGIGEGLADLRSFEANEYVDSII